MNEAENINDFMTKVMKVVNQIRLLGEQFLDSRIVEKVLVVLPERFKSKISALEESKDLSKIIFLRIKCSSSSRAEKTFETRGSNRNSFTSQTQRKSHNNLR